MKKFVSTVVFVILFVMISMEILNAAFDVRDRMYTEDCVKFMSVPNNIRLANLGSSHGEFAFYYDEIEDDINCFNFALSAQTLEYDEKMLDQYIGKMDKNSVMIIPVSYMSFFLNEEWFLEEDFEAKNKRYYSFMSFKNIINGNILEFTKVRIFPFIFSDLKFEIDAKLFDIAKKDNIGGEDAVSQIKNEDRVASDIDVVRDGKDAYGRHVEAFIENGEYKFNDSLIEKLVMIIRKCKDNSITPVLVTTPFLREYNDCVDDVFLKEFHEIVDSVVESEDVVYYDYSDDKRFIDRYDLFMNADHLNKEGGQAFTKIFYLEHLRGIIFPN